MCHQPALTATDAPSEALSDAQLLDRLTGWEREIRQCQARIARDMALLVTRAEQEDPMFGADCAISEIASALTLHLDTAQRQVEQAVTVATRHPATLEVWEAGRITARQVAALVECTDRLEDDAKARAVEARVLPKMPGQVLQATRRALRRAVLAVDPDGARQRHQRAVADRDVGIAPEEDGMATVYLNTSAEQAVAVYERVDQLARVKEQGDPRTLAQRRADVMCAMILDADGSTSAQCSPTSAALVQVTVSLETLLRISREPGEMERYGAVSAETARALASAPGSLWRWLAYDPDSGALIKTSPRVYQPTAEVRRFVQARDRTCAFPGCTRAARRCDLDHVTEFNHECPEAGGETCPENLVPLCRRHHRIKTARGFTSKVLTPGRSVQWTSRRTGRIYDVEHTHDYRPEHEPSSLTGDTTDAHEWCEEDTVR